MRALATVVLLGLVAFVAYAFVSGNAWSRYPRPEPAAVGTSGAVERARETGAEIGEKVGIAATKVKETADEAAITSKIKAKMVLDDSVKALKIDVTTNGSIVTLTGTVRSVQEHDRAVALARETNGVLKVVDRIGVQP